MTDWSSSFQFVSPVKDIFEVCLLLSGCKTSNLSVSAALLYRLAVPDLSPSFSSRSTPTFGTLVWTPSTRTSRPPVLLVLFPLLRDVYSWLISTKFLQAEYFNKASCEDHEDSGAVDEHVCQRTLPYASSTLLTPLRLQDHDFDLVTSPFFKNFRREDDAIVSIIHLLATLSLSLISLYFQTAPFAFVPGDFASILGEKDSAVLVSTPSLYHNASCPDLNLHRVHRVSSKHLAFLSRTYTTPTLPMSPQMLLCVTSHWLS